MDPEKNTPIQKSITKLIDVMVEFPSASNLFLFAFGAALLVASAQLTTTFLPNNPKLIELHMIMVFFLFLFTLAGFLVGYLKTEPEKQRAKEQLEGPATVDKESYDERKDKLLQELNRTVDDTLKQELLNDFFQQSHLKALEKVFTDARSRLLEEIEAQGKRANANLALGTLTNALGILALAYVFFITAPDLTDTSAFLKTNIPRIALAAFVQLLGFFFLRLYRNGLDTIKYFQNELTNIDIKYLALTTAIRCKNEKSLSSIVTTLSKTERNFLLQKGQSTVELQKMKLDSDRIEDLVAVMRQLCSITEKPDK